MSVVPPAAASGSGSAGSLAASYASHSHLEQQLAEAARERGEAVSAEASQYPVRLPTHAGVAHVPRNLTHGTVVDPEDKKRTRFENEKYLRAHPELEALIQDFIVDVLEKRPADIEDAAVQFFVKEGAKRSAAAQAKSAKP